MQIYSKNELRMNYLNQKYILMTSSYQMAVLTLLAKAKVLINEEAEQYDLNPSKPISCRISQP